MRGAQVFARPQRSTDMSTESSLALPVVDAQGHSAQSTAALAPRRGQRRTG